MSKALVLIVLFAAAIALPYGAERQKVGNADIEKLLAAGVGDEVILNVIAGGEANFDTTVDALIALKQKGASPAVLAAITGQRNPEPPPVEPVVSHEPVPAAPPVVSGLAALPPNETFTDVILVDGEKRSMMSYSTPDIRTAGHAFVGLPGGGMARRSYWVLQGPRAQLRCNAKNPAFVVPIPRNGNPDQSLTLVLWETRPNGTREVMVGHAKPVWDSETHGNRPDIARQRLIALQFTQAKEQPPAAAGMTRYEAHPLAPLAPGEYALLTRGRIYDFGVDP